MLYSAAMTDFREEQHELGRWLLARGVSERDLPSYRKALALVRNAVGAATLERHHIEQVLRRERAAGASPRRLDNLAYIGDELLRFSHDTNRRFTAPADRPAELELALPPPRPTARGTEPAQLAAPPSAITGRPRHVVLPAEHRTGGVTDWRDFKSTTQAHCACIGGAKEVFADDGENVMDGGYAAMFALICLGFGLLWGKLVFLSMMAACLMLGTRELYMALGVELRCIQCRDLVDPRNSLESDMIRDTVRTHWIRLGLYLGGAAISLGIYL